MNRYKLRLIFRQYVLDREDKHIESQYRTDSISLPENANAFQFPGVSYGFLPELIGGEWIKEERVMTVREFCAANQLKLSPRDNEELGDLEVGARLYKSGQIEVWDLVAPDCELCMLTEPQQEVDIMPLEELPYEIMCAVYEEIKRRDDENARNG